MKRGGCSLSLSFSNLLCLLLTCGLFFDSKSFFSFHVPVQAAPHVREEKVGTRGSSSSKVPSHSRKVAMMMSKGINRLGGLEKTVSDASVHIPDESGRIYQPEANLQTMPGGYVPQDVKDKDVQKAAKVSFSLNRFVV